MFELTFSLDGLPSLQSGAFGHWRARRSHDKKWKDLVGYAVMMRGRPAKALDYATLVCTRHSAASGPPDDDNLRASFKPLIDSLTEMRVLVDDKPHHMVAEYKWEPCGRGEGHVTIEIRESLRSDPPP